MKKHTTLKSKFNSAFSLVELLVVIAVIAIIAAIAIPQITNTTGAATTARNQRNAQLIASQWGLSYQAGNTNATDVATAVASLPYTNAAGMVFSLGGVGPADITAATDFLAWSNNALVPTTGQ
jgi:type IV pilus assembly protein PilA